MVETRRKSRERLHTIPHLYREPSHEEVSSEDLF
jgi:hypothetical protein